MLGLSLHNQPLKGIYVCCSFLSLWHIRIPYWTLRYLFPAWRIRRSWSLSRCIKVMTTKYLMGLSNSVGGLIRHPDHTRLELGKGELGLYIDGVPELVKGDVANWAALAGVECARFPGYWQHKPSASSLPMGAPPRPGEKVLLHFHGGGYVGESAHPKNGTSSIPRAIMAYSPSIDRALAPEYRKAKLGAHAFPAQLLDALAAYVYLVRTVGFKPADIIVSGDSAGANLALALSRYLLELDDPSLPVPRALVLLSPWGDLTASHDEPGSSYETNMDSDFLTNQTKDSASEGSPAVFAGSKTVYGRTFLSHRYISPAATTCTDWDFKGFPHSYISTGGGEVFLDMNLELARRMERDIGKEGVKTVITPDAFHDFIAFEWWKPERETAAKEIAEWIETV